MEYGELKADPKGPSIYALGPGQSLTIISTVKYEEAYVAVIEGLESRIRGLQATCARRLAEVIYKDGLIEELRGQLNADGISGSS